MKSRIAQVLNELDLCNCCVYKYVSWIIAFIKIVSSTQTYSLKGERNKDLKMK